MAKSPQTIASEIRVELRSILRQLHDLRAPIRRFERDLRRGTADPQYYVMFDMHPRLSITGLRLRTKMMSLPDERIIDAVLEVAKSVWHLKDRLQQWVRVCSPLARHGMDRDGIESWAKQSTNLLVCSDLANEKKHGRNENRSGKRPIVAQVEFDTSKSGTIEYYCDGAIGTKELIVENPVPIAFRVPVTSQVDNAIIGEAIEMIQRAFQHWMPLIQKLGLLDLSDPQTLALRSLLRDVGNVH
jgi:hypothetical protein